MSNSQATEAIPPFTIETIGRGRRRVICLGEEIATLRYDTQNQRWAVMQAEPLPPNGATIMREASQGSSRKRVPYLLAGSDLQGGIATVLASGELPYGETLADRRRQVEEARRRMKIRELAEHRDYRLHRSAPDLYRVLDAAMKDAPGWREQAAKVMEAVDHEPIDV